MQYIFVSLNSGDFIEREKKNILFFSLELPLVKEHHQPLALFGTVSQSFSYVKYKTYQSFPFHQPQQRVLVVVFSKGVPRTKLSVQHPSFIRQLVQYHSIFTDL